MNAARPFAETRLPTFIARSVLALKPRQTQAEIATQVGFTSANMMSMLSPRLADCRCRAIYPHAVGEPSSRYK